MAICKGVESDHSEPNWQSEVFHLVICLTNVLEIVHCAKTFYCRIMITEQNKTNLSRRLRVLFVISDLSGGGAERVVSTYLHHLDRSRFEPGLCLWRDIRAYPVPSDVPVWVMKKNKPWQTPRTVYRMARLIKKWQPDIIFSHLRFVNLLTGIACCFSDSRRAWLPCVHSNPGNKKAISTSPLLTSLMKRRAATIVTVSKGIAGCLQTRFGIPESKLSVLYNPIDFDPIEKAAPANGHKPGDTFQIVTMGRLMEQKDHRTLLYAFAEVRKRYNATLIILGEGPLRSELESLSRDLKLESVIDFKGFVSNPFGIIKASDIFVLSSQYEGFGNALVEAMGCGVVCVSTRCPYGPEEIIEDGKTGLLVPVANAGALSQAILTLLEDPQYRQRLAESGKESVISRFSASVRTRVLEALLFETMRG